MADSKNGPGSILLLLLLPLFVVVSMSRFRKSRISGIWSGQIKKVFYVLTCFTKKNVPNL